MPEEHSISKAARSPSCHRRSARYTVIGRGFNEDVLLQLRRRPEVAGASVENGRLTVELDGNVDSAPLVSLLVYAGAQIQEVHRGSASLEEAFLALVEER